MFKRLATSLSRPPLAVFFMKDRWRRIIGYILFLPLFLLLPMLITRLVDPSMNLDRYELLVNAVKNDFRVENAIIVDGVLSYEEEQTATFDYFTLYIGEQPRNQSTVNFVFETEDMVLYMANVEFDRISYEDMQLTNYDFSSTDIEDVRMLSVALKVFMETQSTIIWTDFLITYMFGLMDYLFIVLLMSMMMLIFINRVQLPFRMRFRLSVYLSSVWIISELVLSLFGASQLEFISILLAYSYHIWAYRSMKIITKEAVK